MSAWTDHAAVVVASGPSAISVPLELFRYRAKFIAVNDSWKLVPWADALYACDESWWDVNNGLPEFAGRRFTASPRTMRRYGIDLFCSTGTNSGLRAAYLAERFGANPICLVGFDMHAKRGIHWHHPYERLRNPGASQMKEWVKETDLAAELFKRRGVKVINCTPGSALTKYPYMPLEQALHAVVGDSSSADPARSPALVE